MKNFLKYVEIATKITSVGAFIYALAFLIFLGNRINVELSIVFFAAMFLFDLTATAINNYLDSRENGIPLTLSRPRAFAAIIILLAIATALGLYLAYRTDAVVLLAGGLCFLCGIFYTAGPLPISRQPLGEVLSGAFYGLFIPFLLLYINLPEGMLLSFSMTKSSTSVVVQNAQILTLLLLAIAPMCATANIMLANNICDLERDIAVKRHTLPYYLGKNALTLFNLLYYASYLSIILLVVLSVLPPLYLSSLLTFPFVWRNMRAFGRVQDKAVTFILSVKNYLLVMGGSIVAMGVCCFVRG